MNSSDFESLKKEFAPPPPTRTRLSSSKPNNGGTKFQFKSLNDPSSSIGAKATVAKASVVSTSSSSRKSDVFLVEDDLWCGDDGLDDDFLLAASQMVENLSLIHI